MTGTECIKREADEIVRRTGRYIPPYRLASLMKMAQRIVDLLTKTDVTVTYSECVIVLSIVRAAIRGATGEEEE
jgi:hypothetical protein